jgi:hypothetical protein
MLETRQPARQAMAMPSPVAPRGAVLNWIDAPRPAGGQDRRAAVNASTCAGLAVVERIDAPDVAEPE